MQFSDAVLSAVLQSRVFTRWTSRTASPPSSSPLHDVVNVGALTFTSMFTSANKIHAASTRPAPVAARPSKRMSAERPGASTPYDTRVEDLPTDLASHPTVLVQTTPLPSAGCPTLASAPSAAQQQPKPVAQRQSPPPSLRASLALTPSLLRDSLLRQARHRLCCSMLDGVLRSHTKRVHTPSCVHAPSCVRTPSCASTPTRVPPLTPGARRCVLATPTSGAARARL